MFGNRLEHFPAEEENVQGIFHGDHTGKEQKVFPGRTKPALDMVVGVSDQHGDHIRPIFIVSGVWAGHGRQ